MIARFLLANNVACYLDPVFAIVLIWIIVAKKKMKVKAIRILLGFFFFSPCNFYIPFKIILSKDKVTIPACRDFVLPINLSSKAKRNSAVKLDF